MRMSGNTNKKTDTTKETVKGKSNQVEYNLPPPSPLGVSSPLLHSLPILFLTSSENVNEGTDLRAVVLGEICTLSPKLEEGKRSNEGGGERRLRRGR